MKYEDVTLSPDDIEWVSAQRLYRVQWHTLGKGRWKTHPRIHKSKLQADFWAFERGFIKEEKARNASRATVYRLVEVTNEDS